jgi:hypothetical protein
MSLNQHFPRPLLHRRHPGRLHAVAGTGSTPSPTSAQPSPPCSGTEPSRSSSAFITASRTTPPPPQPPPLSSPSPSPSRLRTTSSAQLSPSSGPRRLAVTVVPGNRTVLPTVTAAASTYKSLANPLPPSFRVPL